MGQMKLPETNYLIMALITMVPMIAAGLVAWFKRHIIIGWVKKKRKKKL